MRVKVILDKEKIASLYHSGMNMTQVGEEFGVSSHPIWSFMKKHNIKARNKIERILEHTRDEKRINLDKEQIASMYGSGMTQSKIGKALGVCEASIRKFMKEHNIKVRNEKERRMVIKNGK